MSGILSGQTILVTRPSKQAGGLIRRLEDLGAKAITLPLIEIVSEPMDELLSEQLRKMTVADILICVSRNAAEIGTDYCGRLKQALPNTVVAAGKATAASLTSRGVSNVLRSSSASNSEAILALPELQDITGNNIIIWRGGEGRSLLGDTLLQSRGAQVTFVDLYRRSIPGDLSEQVNQFTAPEVDIITLTSVAALSNLTKIVADDLSGFENKKLLVGSQRIYQNAVEQGFAASDTIAADNPGDSAMMAALESHLKSEGKFND